MFAGLPWQRCQYHLQHNAQDYVSILDQRVPVPSTIRCIFNAPDANENNQLLSLALEGWRKDHPKLAACAEDNLAEGFVVFGLPPEHRVRMRATPKPVRGIYRRKVAVSFYYFRSLCQWSADHIGLILH